MAIEILKTEDGRKATGDFFPEIIRLSPNNKVQIAQARELVKRFGIDSPEEVAYILRVTPAEIRKIMRFP